MITFIELLNSDAMKRSHGVTSASSGPSASSTARTDCLIELSYKTTCLYFAPGETRLSGDLSVNDPNSPGGKRFTTVYSMSAWDMRGNYCVFEAWGNDAAKAKTYFETNQRAEGTVYVLPQVPPSTLQYCMGTPSGYQLNQLGVVKRFVLKTLDDTAKVNLKLSSAAMPLPFAFVDNKFTDNGTIIPDPTTWATMKEPSAADAGFSALVEPVSYEELIAKRSKV